MPLWRLLDLGGVIGPALDRGELVLLGLAAHVVGGVATTLMSMPALWWASSTFSTVIGQRPAQVGPLLPSQVRASAAASSGG